MPVETPPTRPVPDWPAAQAAIAEWYRDHARILPWRAPPDSGQRTDPYHVWLSEIMLQQTTVAAVIPYFTRFITTWPTIHALAHAPAEDVLSAWAGLGYYSRARSLIACAQIIVNDHGGAFPSDSDALKRLPGIGDYTAAAIAAIAFGGNAIPVDANIERVVARLAAITGTIAGCQSDDSRSSSDGLAREGWRRFCPGADGSGRHHLHCARTQMHGVPSRITVSGPCP